MAKWLIATGNLRYDGPNDRNGAPEILTVEAEDFKVETVAPGQGAYPVYHVTFMDADGKCVAFLKNFTSIHKEKNNG